MNSRRDRWHRSSDTAVATINQDGTVTGKGAGSVSVIAEQLNLAGAVQLSGSAALRSKWASGAWYLADSVLVPYEGTWSVASAVTLSGGEAVLVLAGAAVTWTRIAPASVLLDAAGKLTLNSSRIVETSPSAVFTYHLLQADVNGDGITDLHFGNSGADVPNPTPSQRDVPKVFLGDGLGGFRETPITSPQVQQHGAAVGATRPNGPVDIMMMSGLCYPISTQGGDTLPAQYRGTNWVPGCAAPGPFILRGKGDGTFTYDNVSMNSFLARSIVGDSTGTVPNIAGAAVCDVNGDGWNDLVVTLKSPTVYAVGYVYLNDKSGRFLSTPLPLPRPPNGRYTSDVYCRDLDGDGRVDLLMNRIDASNPRNGGNVNTDWNILHGNGDGTVTNVTVSALPGQQLFVWTHQISLADINGDGYLDLVGARTEYKDQPPPVWFGTATKGVFRAALRSELPTLPLFSGAAALTVTAHNLMPVTVGSEVMLVSRYERGNSDGSASPQMAAIPAGHALVRTYRRAP